MAATVVMAVAQRVVLDKAQQLVNSVKAVDSCMLAVVADTTQVQCQAVAVAAERVENHLLLARPTLAVVAVADIAQVLLAALESSLSATQGGDIRDYQ